MRKIIFRGKDKFTGEWRFGDLVHNKIVTKTGLEPRVMVGGYEVQPKTVGQFTGLCDCNENPIYEGDILIDDSQNIEFLVIYREINTRFALKPLSIPDDYPCFNDLNKFMNDNANQRIIDNIYSRKKDGSV